MVIRKHGRYPACWPLTLIHNGIEYQGTMQNISLKGCAVTTCLPAFVGMHLRWQMRGRIIRNRCASKRPLSDGGVKT